MELDLRRAFANGEFELHYQPLVDIAVRPDQRLRIAAALAASRKGHDLAGGIHPGRRGHRPDRRARRMGAARGLHGGRKMAGGRQGRRQSVAGAVSQPQPGSGRDLGAGAFRLVAAAARARNHRIGLPGGDRSQSRDPASVARARRQHLDGRFRHRLFQPQLSPQLSVRQDQDRPLVREGSGASAPIVWRSCGRSPALAAASTSRRRPKASRPSTSSTGCAPKAATRCRAFCSARRARRRDRRAACPASGFGACDASRRTA